MNKRRKIRKTGEKQRGDKTERERESRRGEGKEKIFLRVTFACVPVCE